MDTLKDRIGIITGASAGIGEALTRDLAGAGARLVINSRRENRLRELATDLGGDRVEIVPGDAADPGLPAKMLDAAKRRFGREADLVIVNAGRGLKGSVLDSNTDEWDEVVRINILGASHLMREAALRMAAQLPDPAKDAAGFNSAWKRIVENNGPARDIVVLGSTVGRHISPFSSMYGSTKFAVNSLAEALRRQMARHGVRVTLIEPGIVRTEFQESAGYEMEGFTAFMDSVGPVLRGGDISRAILFTISQPPAVHVSDVLIRPTRQEYP